MDTQVALRAFRVARAGRDDLCMRLLSEVVRVMSKAELAKLYNELVAMEYEGVVAMDDKAIRRTTKRTLISLVYWRLSMVGSRMPEEATA